MNKNILIAIIVVIIIAAGAAVMFGQSTGKTQTQIKFLNNDTLQNGEQVIFELKDANGNAIAGATVNLTYNGNENYSVVTDNNGKGYLVITGEDSGKYDVEAKYAGDDKHAATSAKVSITITEDDADDAVTQNSNSSVASTDEHHNDTESHDGCRFLGQYELWVRNSDNVVVQAPNGEGVGLTLDQWMATYGPGAQPDVPVNESTDTE